MALVVPEQWGTAAARPALVGYDQWHPKSGGVRREVSKMVSLGRCRPIIQATRATSMPIESSSKEPGSDYSGDTRKSNGRKAVTP